MTLRGLISAVERGDEYIERDVQDHFGGYRSSKYSTDVMWAYNGSLDAAKRLHDALLPGWSWCGGSFCHAMTVYPPHYPGEEFDAAEYNGDNKDSARAWLLAILKAMEAQSG